MNEVVYKLYWDFPFKIAEKPKGKMLEGRRLNSIYCAEYLPEKHNVLIEEHNNLIKQKDEIETKIKEIAHKIIKV